MCPIIKISNKTGENVHLLKQFILNLPVTTPYIDKIESNRKIFRIHDRYHVKGVGVVVSGQVMEGYIKKGDILYLGPIRGEWVQLTAKGLHNNFRTDVSKLKMNESGCIALNFHDKKAKINKHKIKKGNIIADQKYPLTRRFRAKIMVTTGHSTTMTDRYQPIINCKTIVQAAQMGGMGDKCLRGGEISEVIFRYRFRPEFMNVGDIFIFREGNLRGVGKVIELMS